MEELKAGIQSMKKLFIGFFKWSGIALLVGFAAGVIGALFRLGIEAVTGFRTSHDFMILLLPVSGLLIVWLYRALGVHHDKGTNLVLNSVRSGERISSKMTFLIFFTSIITHAFGGSAGREGAALQIGGSVSAKLGRLLRLDQKDMSIITLCGMSACFSALFGTPVTAAVFAMEVVTVGIMHYSAILPCVAASLVGNTVSSLFGLKAVSFPAGTIPDFAFDSLWRVIVLSAACALVSILLCVVFHLAGHLLQKFLPNPYMRIAAGGAFIAGLTFLIGVRDYNGAGSDMILSYFSSPARPEAFLMKMLFTAITLGAGYKGGEIVPVLFIGAAFGNLGAQFLGLPLGFGAAVGIAALFCGVTNCPLATILLSIELFGAEGLPFYGLAIAISYMLSGYEGLYSGQKIFYSKLKPAMIDKRTGDWTGYTGKDK